MLQCPNPFCTLAHDELQARSMVTALRYGKDPASRSKWTTASPGDRAETRRLLGRPCCLRMHRALVVRVGPSYVGCKRQRTLCQELSLFFLFPTSRRLLSHLMTFLGKLEVLIDSCAHESSPVDAIIPSAHTLVSQPADVADLASCTNHSLTP